MRPLEAPAVRGADHRAPGGRRRPALLRLRRRPALRVGHLRGRGVRRLHAAHRARPPLDRRRGDRRHRADGRAAHLDAGRPLRPHPRQGAGRDPGAVLRGRPADRPPAGDRCGPSCSERRRCRRSASAPPRWPGPRWSTRAAGAGAGTTCGPARWWSTYARVPVVEEPEEEAPRQVVNLTAMRLVPASPTPPRRVPTRGKRPPAPPPEAAAPPPPPTVTPRQGLGWPLVGEAPRDAPSDVLAPAEHPADPPTAAGPRRTGSAPSRVRRTTRHRRCGGRSPSTPASSSRCAA